MDENYSQAHPLTFTDFLEKMKDPRAADLVRSIKAFIASFKTAPPDPVVYAQKVQQFLASCDASFQKHPLWAGTDAACIDAAGEGLEKYVMTKLYDKCFRLAASDREGDELLSTYLRALSSFVKPEHLEIPNYFTNETQWGLAQKELHKINSYKAPRDKLVCILNCCRVINNLLTMTNSGPAGADDFFPVLVYIVIRTNPPNLKSNLEYIRRFRGASRLVSEAAYFYTNMESASQFIENINSRSLQMEEEAFLSCMAASGIPRERLLPPAAPPPPPPATAPTSPPHPSARAPLPSSPGRPLPSDIPPLVASRSVAELEAEGISHLIDAEARGELRNLYRWLYASAGDLTVSDAESLLSAYKELVLRYEALSRAVAAQPAVDLPSLIELCCAGPSRPPAAVTPERPSMPQESTAVDGTELAHPGTNPSLSPNCVERGNPSGVGEANAGVGEGNETAVGESEAQPSAVDGTQLAQPGIDSSLLPNGVEKGGPLEETSGGVAEGSEMAVGETAVAGGEAIEEVAPLMDAELGSPLQKSSEALASVRMGDGTKEAVQEKGQSEIAPDVVASTSDEGVVGRNSREDSGEGQHSTAMEATDAVEVAMRVDDGWQLDEMSSASALSGFREEEEAAKANIEVGEGGREVAPATERHGIEETEEKATIAEQLSADDLQKDCEEAALQSLAVDESFEQALTGVEATEIPAAAGTEWRADADASLI